MPVESSCSNYFFTVDYVASAVVLFNFLGGNIITISFNFKRIKSLKKCSTWNTQGKTAKLSTVYWTSSTRDIERLTPRGNSKKLNTTKYMLQKQIRTFDVKILSFKNTWLFCVSDNISWKNTCGQRAYLTFRIL